MGSKIEGEAYYSVSDTVSLIDSQFNNVSSVDISNNATVENRDNWYMRWCNLGTSNWKWPKSRLFNISATLFMLSTVLFILTCIAMIRSSPKILNGQSDNPLFSDENIDEHFNSARTKNSSCCNLSAIRKLNSLKPDLDGNDAVFHLKEGDVLNLWCSVSDKYLSEKSTPVLIKWSRGNQTLDNSKENQVSVINYRFSKMHFISFLIHPGVSITDSGDYYCSLSFPYEECRQKITVKVTQETTSSMETVDEKSQFSKFEISEKDRIIFNENFDSLNISGGGGGKGVWRFEQGYQNFEMLTSSHNTSYTKDGIVYLKPVLTNDIHGEDFLYNGTLLLGEEPFEDICSEHRDRTTKDSICWKEGHPEDIIHPVMVPVLRSEFGFVYGKVEIRAQMPTGDWIVPVISLIPEFSTYGKSSSSFESGLIDMVNTNGNKVLLDKTDNVNKGVESNCPALRYGTKSFPTHLSFCFQLKEGFDSDFHLYQLEWTPKYISLSIDGENLVVAPYPKKTMFDRAFPNNAKVDPAYNNKLLENPWKFPLSTNEKMAPFDHFFSLRIGLSIGGTKGTFPDEYQGAYEKPWNNSDPKAALSFWEKRHLWEPSWDGEKSALKIDYIRIWEMSDTKYSYERLY